MSPLSGHAADYLELRRALGFRLAKEGRLLPDFAAFAEAAGADTITVDLAVRWAARPDGTSPVWAAQRLSIVRGFARYLHTVDPDAQVPPAGLLPARTRRVTPYIYSDADIAALMGAAGTLRNPLKAATFATLIGLLAEKACASARRSACATPISSAAAGRSASWPALIRVCQVNGSVALSVVTVRSLIRGGCGGGEGRSRRVRTSAV
jgi:hypothetical protein